LQRPVSHNRWIFGDLASKQAGEQANANLVSLASRPITSDGRVQAASILEARNKGQQYINQGNATDNQMIRNTMEVAWQQEKENRNNSNVIANSNMK